MDFKSKYAVAFAYLLLLCESVLPLILSHCIVNTAVHTQRTHTRSAGQAGSQRMLAAVRMRWQAYQSLE